MHTSYVTFRSCLWQCTKVTEPESGCKITPLQSSYQQVFIKGNKSKNEVSRTSGKFASPITPGTAEER